MPFTSNKRLILWQQKFTNMSKTTKIDLFTQKRSFPLKSLVYKTEKFSDYICGLGYKKNSLAATVMTTRKRRLISVNNAK